MPLEMTEEQVRAHCARNHLPIPKELQGPAKPRGRGDGDHIGDATEMVPKKRRTKYGNEKVKVDGITFDSKHEAARYGELKLLRMAGQIRGFAPQVTFPLPGGVKYIADFVVLQNDGTYTVEDAKSEATRMDKVYRLKKRQLRECMGIVIREV